MHTISYKLQPYMPHGWNGILVLPIAFLFILLPHGMLSSRVWGLSPQLFLILFFFKTFHQKIPLALTIYMLMAKLCMQEDAFLTRIWMCHHYSLFTKSTHLVLRIRRQERQKIEKEGLSSLSKSCSQGRIGNDCKNGSVEEVGQHYIIFLAIYHFHSLNLYILVWVCLLGFMLYFFWLLDKIKLGVAGATLATVL